MDISLTILNPFTIMIGFAYNNPDYNGDKRLEIFLGIFAISFVWGNGYD